MQNHSHILSKNANFVCFSSTRLRGKFQRKLSFWQPDIVCQATSDGIAVPAVHWAALEAAKMPRWMVNISSSTYCGQNADSRICNEKWVARVFGVFFFFLNFFPFFYFCKPTKYAKTSKTIKTYQAIFMSVHLSGWESVLNTWYTWTNWNS